MFFNKKKGEGAGYSAAQKSCYELCGIVSAAHLEEASVLSLRPFYYIVGGGNVRKRDPRK
jgi:hypothetical protein